VRSRRLSGVRGLAIGALSVEHQFVTSHSEPAARKPIYIGQASRQIEHSAALLAMKMVVVSFP
jgi:hypothetical protein